MTKKNSFEAWTAPCLMQYPEFFHAAVLVSLATAFNVQVEGWSFMNPTMKHLKWKNIFFHHQKYNDFYRLSSEKFLCSLSHMKAMFPNKICNHTIWNRHSKQYVLFSIFQNILTIKIGPLLLFHSHSLQFCWTNWTQNY